MDLGKLFGDAAKAAETGMTDILKQGGNAALGYLEQQAIAIISEDKTQRETQMQGALQQQLTAPSNPSSFGAYMQKVATDPIVKQYGPTVLIGVGCTAVLVAAIFFMKGK